MSFWDASAVLPLCARQRESKTLARLARRYGHLVVWWGTPVEVHSALARLVRDGTLAEVGRTQAAQRLAVLRRSWVEVLPTERVRSLAEALPAQYDLRAGDAFQLAAAAVWCKERPRSRPFVCYDRHLALAAEQMGFQVIPQ